MVLAVAVAIKQEPESIVWQADLCDQLKVTFTADANATDIVIHAELRLA